MSLQWNSAVPTDLSFSPYPYNLPMPSSVHFPQMNISEQVSHVQHFEFFFQCLYPRPINTSSSSPDTSACTVCQSRTGSTRTLLRYSAGVRQSSETQSNVTVRVSSYPRTRPALSALPHSAHSQLWGWVQPWPGAALMFLSAALGSLVSHTCQRDLPSPGNSLPHSI